MSTKAITLPRPTLVETHWFTRLWEIFPGALTWTFLLAPVILSITDPVWVAYFIIAFDLFWMFKSFRLSFYLIKGYRTLSDAKKIDWNERLRWLDDLDHAYAEAKRREDDIVRLHPAVQHRIQYGPQSHKLREKYLEIRSEVAAIEELQGIRSTIMAPSDIYHIVIIATYNEPLEVLEPSLSSLTRINYPLDHMLVVIAYEQRGGERVAKNAKHLIEKYGSNFGYAVAIEHPAGLPNEAPGKGANISYAGHKITSYVLEKMQISAEQAVVTTFDSDHRADPNYFAYLAFIYATTPDRIHKSYQPIPMFYNNIWDAPAPMRVIATGNSFWMVMEAMRPHRLRNFAAHAQSLQTLIDTDYWSLTSIVEDGHQFWRTYFVYEGDHKVVPIFIPIYQDAVLSDGYLKTFKAQYLQLRRWAWGASDIAYVVKNSLIHKRIPWGDKLQQLYRLVEGHFSWATAPLILSLVAWLPLIFNERPDSNRMLFNQLPIIASQIMSLTMLGIVITIWISFISLPPRPARYRRGQTFWMLAQWILLPVTAIVFSAFAAIDAQTRLMIGKYMDFRVTDKAIKK